MFSGISGISVTQKQNEKTHESLIKHQLTQLPHYVARTYTYISILHSGHARAGARPIATEEEFSAFPRPRERTNIYPT